MIENIIKFTKPNAGGTEQSVFPEVPYQLILDGEDYWILEVALEGFFIVDENLDAGFKVTSAGASAGSSSGSSAGGGDTSALEGQIATLTSQYNTLNSQYTTLAANQARIINILGDLYGASAADDGKFSINNN